VSTNADSRFVALVRSWLVSLPHDLKVAYEAMDDENLPRSARELAVGAIMYVVSPHDAVTDRNYAVASFVDDAILLHLALVRIMKQGADSPLRERFPEVFETLEQDIELCRAATGDLMNWLESKLDNLGKLEHKSRKIPVYLDNDDAREELFEDGLVFRTDYPIDEGTVGDKLKKASTVTDAMKKRRAEELRQGA
jgi:uncharacterized membrane protein YkvA (DUF1232 family)